MSLNIVVLVSVLLSVALYRHQATCQDQRVLSKPRSLRLPNATMPLHYNWHVTTNVHTGNFSFKGNVTVDIEIKENTDEIVMHAKDLRNFQITCTDLETMQELTDLTHTHDNKTNFLIIHAKEYYQVFEVMKTYRLEILYEGTMNDKYAGLYWLSYKDENNKTTYHAATQFEPTSARMALPCYDEPAFKANFTIKITHGKIYNAISNMREESVIQHSDSDLATTTFATSPLMSSYLVAFVVSNFGFISQEQRNITHRVFTPPLSKNKGQKQLEFSVKTVAAIEQYLGIAYPLAKLDHVALNKNYGAAMENWGLITYKEDHLLYSDSYTRQKVKDTLTIVHEISHQWFGNLVSPEWWSYTWLNEGFATYFAHIFIDLIHPEYKSIEYFLIETADRAYSYNQFNMNPHPMTQYVETDRDIATLFDIITYSKSACVIRMFHNAFNKETFVRGLETLFRKYEYSVINEYQLAECLQEALEADTTLRNSVWVKNVKDIIVSWTHSNWIPIVYIIRDYDDNSVTIHQRSKNPDSVEHWWIPLNFATASSNDFSNTVVDYFMPATTERVTLQLSDYGIKIKPGDWLVVNKQQTGFYHVFYDDENLYQISQALQLNYSVIHEFNRADIFQNLHYQIEHNNFTIEVVLELLKYLVQEDNLLVWNYVAPTAELLEDYIFGTPSHEPFKEFLRKIIAPIYRKLISKSHSSDKMITDKLHTPILRMACLVDLPECLDYTRKLSFGYIFENNDFDTDSSDYFVTKDTVLCSGLRNLTSEAFNNITRILSTIDHGTEHYEDILYNLRCTQSAEQVRSYLDIVFGPISKQYIADESESLIYVTYMFRTNKMARDIIWEYINDHLETLMKLSSFVDIFNRISEYVMENKRKQYNDLHGKVSSALKSRGEEYSSSLIAIDSPKIGKKVKMNEIFLKHYSTDVNSWFNVFIYT